jgi:hypothetical protein
VKRFPGWLTWQALTLPKLESLKARGDAPGRGHLEGALAVQNTGYLPSYVTKRALERKSHARGGLRDRPSARAVACGGKPRFEGGQLEGRASKPSLQAFLPNRELTGDRGQCEWTVRRAHRRGRDVVARHDRAGRVELAVTLPSRTGLLRDQKSVLIPMPMPRGHRGCRSRRVRAEIAQAPARVDRRAAYSAIRNVRIDKRCR